MNSSPSGYFTMSDRPPNFIKADLESFKNEVDATLTSFTGGADAALADPGANGIVVRTATSTTVARTITGTANQVGVANGDGVSGNPTLSIPSNAQLSIAKITNLTSNGFVKTSGGDGSLSIDTATYATQAYADALVVGLLDDRGNYDASGNVFPSSGGSGTAGAIKKGDLWTISVAGTLGGHPVTAGDVVRALVDTPGSTDTNWAIGENNFGYVALNQALADGKIYVGNASGIGTAVTPSGDVTISNAGVTAIGALKVLNSMIANSTIDLTTKVTSVLPSVNGGTGVNNAGTITNASNTTITGGGALALGGFTFTIPADGSAAMLNQANNFTLINPLTTIPESWIGPSSTAGIYFKSGNVGVGTVDPTFKLDVQGVGASTLFSVAASSGGTGYAIAQVINAGGVAYVAVDNSTGSSFGAGNYASIFGSSGAHPTALITDALPRLTVLHTSGNVGIARVDPSYKLDVNGTFRSGGTATFQVDANPLTNYTSNLGALSNKYLTLHAAELWVETLVAQNTMATIGGRVLVVPTNVFTVDVAPGDTTITVKYNNFLNGSSIRSEADGKVEFMTVTSSASGSAGAYVYSVTRNVDGSGANQWYAGDAAIKLGTTGDGHIDIYSTAGILSGSGPTIAGNVKTGTAHNAIESRWVIGNLNGSYGYGSDTYGAAFGVPGATWIATDATNGFRVMNDATPRIHLAADGSGFVANSNISWDTSGNLTVAANATIGSWAITNTRIASTNVFLDQFGQYLSMGASPPTSYGSNVGVFLEGANSGRLSLYKDANNYFQWDSSKLIWKAANSSLDSSGNLTINAGLIGGWTINSAAIQNSAATVMLRGAGNLAFGSTPPTSASAGTGLFLDSTGMVGLLSNVVQAKFDAATGAITAGAGNVILDSGGVSLIEGQANGNMVKWRAGSDNIGVLSVHRNSSINTSMRVSSLALAADTTGYSRLDLSAYNVAATGAPAGLYFTNYSASHSTAPNKKVAVFDVVDGLAIGSISSLTIPNAMLDVRGDGIITGLLKTGSDPTTLTDSAGKILSAALKDYEEGTWTPVRNGFTEAGGGSITNVGTFTRMGRLVIATVVLKPAGGATIAGAVGAGSFISGLPYTAASPTGTLGLGLAGGTYSLDDFSKGGSCAVRTSNIFLTTAFAATTADVIFTVVYFK